MEAFIIMHESGIIIYLLSISLIKFKGFFIFAGLSSLAVVDEASGRLLDTVSASDLKGVLHDRRLLSLLKPLDQYLKV